jgi:hypothetical protein
MGIRSGIRHLGFTIAAAAIAVGCASDSLTLPGEGEPAYVTIVEGNDQQGLVGNLLSDSLIVSITDIEDRPVVNRNISFKVPSGTIQPANVMTNGEGKAVFRWILGPAAGQQQLDAGLGTGDQLSPKVTFTATAMPGPVQAMAAMSGDGQTATAGTPLPQPLVVRLLDQFGNGVAGASVDWQASAGALSQRTTVTGEDGSASVVWTLGSGLGVQTTTASFQGANGSPIGFTATATPGASPRLEVVTQPSATTQSGKVLVQQPSVRMETAQGAPITKSGVNITAAIASGGGTLSGTTTVPTSSSGIAQFTDLVITGSTGSRTLIFAAAGHTPAVSSVIEVIAPALPGPSAQHSTAHVPNGKPLRWTKITITTRDAQGNPLNRGGYSGLIKVSVSGSNTVASLAIVDKGNGTYEASYFPIFKGNDDISITISGAPIQGSPYQSKVK